MWCGARALRWVGLLGWWRRSGQANNLFDRLPPSGSYGDDGGGWQTSGKLKKKRRRLQAPLPATAVRQELPLELAGRCFNCLGDDHVAALCPNPTKCLRCKGEGHVARLCRVTRSSRSPPPRRGVGSLQPVAQRRGLKHRPVVPRCSLKRPWHVAQLCNLGLPRSSFVVDSAQGQRSWRGEGLSWMQLRYQLQPLPRLRLRWWRLLRRRRWRSRLGRGRCRW